MNRSAIVLAGGFSSRFGEDKGVLKLAGKPLLTHVTDAVRDAVDEVIVVTSSEDRVEKYASLVAGSVRFAVDQTELKGPLVGALSGFSVARGEYCLLLPFDTPFVSGDVVSLLFEVCQGKAAVIPRWPNGQIEPLHAVYHTAEALNAARIALDEGRLDMRGMIEKLRGVRFISTLIIRQLDPELRTFFNVNTKVDLLKAVRMMKQRKKAR